MKHVPAFTIVALLAMSTAVAAASTPTGVWGLGAEA